MKKLLLLLLTVAMTGYGAVNIARIQQVKENYVTTYNSCTMLGSHIAPHIAMVIAYMLVPGDLVLDVGGYIGDYSLYYGKLVGTEGMVITYEANPYVFPYMAQRLATEGGAHIFAKERAVSSTTGQKLWMKVYPNDLGPQSCTVEPGLMNEGRMPGSTAMVEVVTEKLDEVLKMQVSTPVRFIKIDTEGHEHDVLEGATQLLLTQRPFVIFEYGYVPEKYETGTIQQLEALGYFCYDLITDKRVYSAADVQSPDLLAVPIEHAQEMVEVLPYLY